MSSTGDAGTGVNLRTSSDEASNERRVKCSESRETSHRFDRMETKARAEKTVEVYPSTLHATNGRTLQEIRLPTLGERSS